VTATGADRTLALLEAQVGRTLAEVETPVAVIDLDRLEANLTELQAYADAHRLALWPHAKTHKSPEIGRRQLDLGAAGLTVAKTGEAQVFQEAGVTRLLVHYPPFGDAKWERLADLAAAGVELTVAVDSVEPAEGLARAFDRRGVSAELLVELDVGLHRTGQTTVAGAVEVAERLDRLPALAVAGISSYPGHCRRGEPDVAAKLRAVDGLLRETRDALDRAGLRCDRISGGSTPTRHLTHTTCVNELRAGTYALLDRNEADDERCALWIEATVVSNAVHGQVVVDGGSKTFTSDPYPDGGHGSVIGAPAAWFARVNEEHGYIDVSSLDEAPRLGDHLQIVPNHACGCINLHDGALAVRNGVVDHVIRIAGRGLVR
jgi:D-serine deaminase-like pyridoxal phosphate-dependent protein